MGQTSFPPEAILVSDAGVIGATAAGQCVNLTSAQVRSLASVYSTAQVDTLLSSKANTATTLAGYGITDGQPLDADLTAIAALTTTTYGRSLLTGADAAATRTTLGLGTMATQAASSYLALSGGTLTGGLSGTTAYFSGNVGIGTASPLAKLHIEGAVPIDGFGLYIKNTSTSGYTVVRLGGTYPYSTGAFYALGSTYATSGPYVQNGFALETLGAGGLSLTAGHASAEIRLYTGGLLAGNERARIFSGGNVAIGKTTDDGVNKLQVAGSISASGGVAVGPVTFAVLNATTPSLGAGEWRVTDRGNRRAYPDGTNWRWVGDDSIIL